MPYKTIEAAKAANFPVIKEEVELTLEQINKLAEIYDAIKAGGDADNPMAVAWNAWLNVYKKEGDKWILANTQQHISTNMEPAQKHDAILQTLDVDLNGLFYAKTPFATSVDSWDGIPLVFAQHHPDAKLFEDNPVAALEAINGRIVGNVKSPYISQTGHSTLRGELNITDKTIDTLIGAGKASTSTAFFYDEIANAITSVRPNHVLIFEEDTLTYPNDRGSIILNQGSNIDKIITEVRAFFNRLLKSGIQIESNQHKNKEVVKKEMEKIEEMAVELQTANLGLATSKAELERLTTANETVTKELEARNTAYADLETTHAAELKTVTDELTGFKDDAAARLKADRDQKWATLKKEQIPPGLTHNEEDEQKLRESFEKTPHTFMMELVKYNTADGTDPEGADYTAQQDKDLASIRQLKEDTGRA